MWKSVSFIVLGFLIGWRCLKDKPKQKGGKNYEKEREKEFVDWKYIPYNVYSMDSFDSDGGCTASVI